MNKNFKTRWCLFLLLEESSKKPHHPTRSKASQGRIPIQLLKRILSMTILTNSEVGQLCKVVPGARHFHKIIQNMNGIKFQAFGFVYSTQNVLWNKNKNTPQHQKGARNEEKQEGRRELYSSCYTLKILTLAQPAWLNG